MKDWNEKELEKFIRENKDILVDGCRPITGHEEKFLMKLQSRVKKFVELTPYFVKVAIITVIIFICSYLIWNNFIRKDKNKPVIENIIEQFKSKK
jgi:hypothetical protein